MIIGEFQSEYDGYDEANFDYLFKRKPKAGQTKAERKDMHKQRKATRRLPGGRKFPLIGRKKRPVQGNFGIFDKEKVQETAGTTELPPAETLPDTPPSPTISAPAEPITTPKTVLPSPMESSETGEIKIPANKVTEVAKTIVPADDKSSSPTPVSELTAENKETVSPVKPNIPSNPKEASFAKFIGFGGLFIVVCILGYTMFRAHQTSAAVK